MPSHRIDHVRIRLSRGVVEIPWESRNALIEEIRHLDSAKPIVDAFEAAGVSRPILFTREQKADLIEFIEFWGSQVQGGLTDGLPQGMFELRNALHDDLHDTQEGTG